MGKIEFRGARVSVDCVKNDPVDKRCGGPVYLGYDFIVKLDELEEMMEYIAGKIEEYGLPLENIYAYDENDFDIEYLWTKEKIDKEIPKYRSLILSQVNSRHR